MIRLAVRNLFQNKARLVISVGGVALALMLILSLDAVFTGMERQVTAWINHSGADVFVSQSGVRNMHMAASSLPASVQAEIETMSGVESVTPILYLTNMVITGEDRTLAYILGVPGEARAGLAWKMASGRAQPEEGEAVIDRSIAEKSGLGLGDEVEIMGRAFEIAGLSEGTSTLASSVAFIAMPDFAALRASPDVVSFLLVKLQPGEPANAFATRIESEVSGVEVTAQSRDEFAAQERRVIRDMGSDVLAIMNLVGFMTGLAVMALTVYTATLARRAEYGVLKALGARNGTLYRVVSAQALLSVILGLALGLAFTLLIASVAPRLGGNLAMELSGPSVLKVAAVSLIIAGISALLPIRQIAGLDPAMVFRGK